jgi:MFS family permease
LQLAAFSLPSVLWYLHFLAGPSGELYRTMSELVLSGYFAGYTIGTVCCARIIERVGRIRTYAALAGFAVMAALTPATWWLLVSTPGFYRRRKSVTATLRHRQRRHTG